jgi:hypothetical protein
MEPMLIWLWILVAPAVAFFMMNAMAGSSTS